MKKVRVLNVVFDQPIKRHELPAFRGAIIDKTDRKSILFHNHIGDNKFLNRYPHIQYKYIKGKPGILCIDEGTDEIHHFFNKSSWEVSVSDRKMPLSVESLDLKDFTFKVNGKMQSYKIKNWLGLNKANFQRYQDIEGLSDKVSFLEKILTGNILSMAKSIDWIINETIKIKIINIDRAYAMPLKGVKLAAFDLHFLSNVTLPNYLGLGKAAGQGYGMVLNAEG